MSNEEKVKYERVKVYFFHRNARYEVELNLNEQHVIELPCGEKVTMTTTHLNTRPPSIGVQRLSRQKEITTIVATELSPEEHKKITDSYR